MQTVRSFVGMDVHKETISISVAEDGRNGPVRFLGVIPNAADDVAKMAKRLSKHGELDFCYEASGCGYGIHRQLTALGHKCIVVAPSMIPRKPGERIKTDRRDSEKLAILHRSGDLTPVWVRDTTHEALRDLVRARVDASMHLKAVCECCTCASAPLARLRSVYARKPSLPWPRRKYGPKDHSGSLAYDFGRLVWCPLGVAACKHKRPGSLSEPFSTHIKHRQRTSSGSDWADNVPTLPDNGWAFRIFGSHYRTTNVKSRLGPRGCPRFRRIYSNRNRFCGQFLRHLFGRYSSKDESSQNLRFLRTNSVGSVLFTEGN